MADLDDKAAQTAEAMDLFPKMVRADREVMLRYMRARVAKFRAEEEEEEEEEQERLFVAPIATLMVAQNIGIF
jgi:hypothetical protein